MKIILRLQLVALLLLAFTAYVSLVPAYYHIASTGAHLRELKKSTDSTPRANKTELYKFTDIEFAELAQRISQTAAGSTATLLAVALIGSALTILELLLLSRFQRQYVWLGLRRK